jgi:hypothetical protein
MQLSVFIKPHLLFNITKTKFNVLLIKLLKPFTTKGFKEFSKTIPLFRFTAYKAIIIIKGSPSSNTFIPAMACLLLFYH